MVEKPYAFISYSRRDRAFVDKLTEALNQAGIPTWTDTANIYPGQDWQAEIQRGLLKAQVLLYIAGQNTAESQWVNRELEAFRRGGGQIVPIILDDVGLRSLPAFLHQIQWA